MVNDDETAALIAGANLGPLSETFPDPAEGILQTASFQAFRFLVDIEVRVVLQLESHGAAGGFSVLPMGIVGNGACQPPLARDEGWAYAEVELLP